MIEGNQTAPHSAAGRASTEFVPQGDAISTETIVNLLVRKGICTIEEIFMLEGQIRDQREELQHENYVHVKEMSESASRRQHSRWKKLFSKYRWTRRLGTKLFGWKWKKVKRSTKTELPLNHI